jgi:xylulokinase
MTLLGIDIGSTALKAATFSHDGRQTALARVAYRRREQGPLVWWSSARRAVRDLLAQSPSGGAIEAIGLSGRGGTSVFLDERGRPVKALFPPRAGSSAFERAVEIVASRRGGHGIRFLAGVIALRQAEPDLFRRVARAMVAKDYVLYRLTGRFFTDPASSVDREDWPEGIFEAPELAGVSLPAIRWPWQEAGRLSAGAATELGLPAGIPVAVGAHDGAAATIGVGASAPGRHSVTLGTNAVYRIVSGEGSRQANRFWTTLPGQTVYGADVTLGGYAVDWTADLLGRPKRRLEREAEAVPAGCEGAIFLPQLNGRILPMPSGSAAGAFVGLRRQHGPAHLYRAVLEGNAYALRAARGALLADGDLPDGEIYLTGGGAVSPLWRQMLADVFRRPVCWSGVEDGCRGAAMFAAVVAGVYEDIEAAFAAMTGDADVQKPSEVAPDYEATYERFLRARDSLDVL